jgi:ubiquinone/menaquinone biosynthesis C-methylase UbiE
MTMALADRDEIRAAVAARYAGLARAARAGQPVTDGDPDDPAGCAAVYPDAGDLPEGAVRASLGCGNPVAVADLRPGETVLDLGSGAGADVLISARRVAPRGRAIGLDMTDEMLELARANAAEAGVDNVEFVKGYLEEMPLDDASVDVVISNCVINLSGDKSRVLREASRVLRPGGRFAVSDVLADPGMDDATKADMAAWTGCIAGALTETEFRRELEASGFEQIDVQPTHRVHEHASAAIIRARKPSPATPG